MLEWIWFTHPLSLFIYYDFVYVLIIFIVLSSIFSVRSILIMPLVLQKKVYFFTTVFLLVPFPLILFKKKIKKRCSFLYGNPAVLYLFILVNGLMQCNTLRSHWLFSTYTHLVAQLTHYVYEIWLWFLFMLALIRYLNGVEFSVLMK